MTKTQKAILAEFKNADQCATRADLVRHTTEKGLNVHLSALRQQGYVFIRQDDVYTLVVSPNVNVAGAAKTILTYLAQEVAQMTAALSDKRTQHTALPNEIMELEASLQKKQAALTALEEALHDQ